MNGAKNFFCPIVLIVFFGSVGCDNPSQQKNGSLAKTSSETSTSANPNEQSKREKSLEPRSENIHDNHESVKSGVAATAILDACIAKYKNLKSYQDQGILKIRYVDGDKPISKVEPMRIAFEPPNRLALRCNGLQSSWTNLTWEAIMNAEYGPLIGKQRVVRPRPDKIDLDFLIMDNLQDLLADRVTGPPIQLSLLMEEKPLAAFLTDPNIVISLLKPDTFDSALCDRIQLSAKNLTTNRELTWILWIDQSERLLRKFEYPIEFSNQFARNPSPSPSPATNELSIEMIGAKADTTVHWGEWELPRNSDELLVSRFVNAPVNLLPNQLGQVLKPFDLRDANNAILLDSAQRKKPITVLCWVGDDELSEQFVKFAMELIRKLKGSNIENSVEWVFIAKSGASDMQQAFKRWNCDLPLAIDHENLTESLFGMKRHPSLMVLDKQVMVQHADEIGYLEHLPEILSSILNGVQLAARNLQKQLDDQARYVSRLHRATLERIQSDRLAPIEPFPMQFHDLQRIWQTKLDAKVIAAAGEQFYPLARSPWSASDVFDPKATELRVMVTLDEFGDVHAIDNTGKRSLVARIPIDKADNAKRIHIAIDPWTHQWIAIIPEGLPRYWLFEMPLNMRITDSASPKDPTEYLLDESEAPNVFTWVAQGNKPSLIVATTRGKLNVLDPMLGKALSGQTNGVVGIVPTLNDRGECVGWNAVDPVGGLSPIDNLPSDGATNTITNATSTDPTLKTLPFAPELGQWTWGRNQTESLLVGLGKLPTGEVGEVVHSMQFKPIFTHPLSVRSEQCRILSSTTLANGNFYWVSTAPRRVLHLLTKDGPLPDQLSLGRPIMGASLLPEDNQLRLTLAVDDEVSSWRISIPPLPNGPNAESPTPASNDKENAAEKRGE